MKKSKIVTLLSIIIAFTLISSAARAAPLVEDDPKTIAIYELFSATKMKSTFRQTIAKMLDLQIKQRPQMAPYRAVMLKFFAKYMGWNSLKADMAKIYASKFTVAEIKKLTAFYQTPLGIKTALLLPQLAAEGAALGQRKVQANLGELRKMIVAETAKIKAKK
ncbi:hypothetical protein MNBD_GAMMA12-2493 [hydrothermal vent metagenome]|uniref:DUF2059 domain-containing protein n=1 Tax=hydrothermal vent metagenome TaxID=652676 RepID=A0A3B0YKV7_9ZZZZ